MGIDLRILPQSSQNANFSNDVISLHCDYELFDIIRKLEKKNGRDVPINGINSFCGRRDDTQGYCYGETLEDHYGSTIKGVQAKELKKVLKDYNNSSWKNKAFIAFLNELPDDLEIWLYWH